MKMAMATKVEKINKETIRPSSPTPLHLKTLKLSLMDQFTPITYVPLVLFYPSNSDHHQRTQNLKTSLSQTLSSNHFYPFAGRLKDNVSIDCNDEGVEFIEARINCSLSDILNNPDIQLLGQFLPATLESPEAASGNLLLVQATFFNCNGLAIGVCVSHKMADAATLTTFINCWASMANNNNNNKVVSSPVFMGASLFPPLPLEMSIPITPVELMMQLKCMTKRFVFTGSKIESLRAKVASTTVPQPTRVEAVSALIWKAVMTAVRANHQLFFRKSVWSISVNLRKRLLPQLPENYAGNCVGFISPKIEDENTQIDLPGLVSKIRKEMENFDENYAKKLQGEGALLAICGFSKEFGDMAMSNDIDFYVCSSWCKYDLYGADFGWGKPIWLSSSTTTVRNVAVLMDTRDGHGIEVWLTLSEEDMALLESNQELLEFAAVNPSVPF